MHTQDLNQTIVCENPIIQNRRKSTYPIHIKKQNKNFKEEKMIKTTKKQQPHRILKGRGGRRRNYSQKRILQIP